VILPAGIAFWLTRLRVDGRAAHAAALAWAGWRFGPKRFSAFRPVECPGTRLVDAFVLAPDAGGAGYRRCIVTGPAEVTLRYPASARIGRRTISLRATGGGPMWHGKRLALQHGRRLRVR
jgi:hypothetical protein